MRRTRRTGMWPGGRLSAHCSPSTSSGSALRCCPTLLTLRARVMLPPDALAVVALGLGVAIRLLLVLLQTGQLRACPQDEGLSRQSLCQVIARLYTAW